MLLYRITRGSPVWVYVWCTWKQPRVMCSHLTVVVGPHLMGFTRGPRILESLSSILMMHGMWIVWVLEALFKITRAGSVFFCKETIILDLVRVC